MKKTQSAKKKVKANRVFTDRKTPRDAFWDNYIKVAQNLHNDEDVHVLTYYGIGGIGKSRLLDELQIELQQQEYTPLFAYYDFGDSSDMRSVLRALKSSLARDYHFNFHLYDLAEYAYAEKNGEKVKREDIPALTEKSPILNLLLSGAEAVSLASAIPQLIRLGDLGVQWVRNLVENHKTELKELTEISKSELYYNLPYYFAKDLSENMQEQEVPLVIFLDTYEMLVNEMNMVGEPYSKDMWVRGENGLICNADDVLWVIAGRERLKWDKFNAEWKDSLDQHMLDTLSDKDIVWFLEESGMKPRSLCEAMVTLTGGTPVYLDLCMDQYEELLKQGRVPTPDDFGQDTGTLVNRFIRDMDGSVKDIVYILTCLERWTDKAIKKLGPAIIPSFHMTNYGKVKGFSFINIKEDGSYEMHKTVREVLFGWCEPWLCEDTFKNALELYGEICNNSSDLEEDSKLTMIVMMSKYCCYLYRGEELLDEYISRMTSLLNRIGGLGKIGKLDEICEFLYEWSKTDSYALPLAQLTETTLRISTGEYDDALRCVELGLQELARLEVHNDRVEMLAMRKKMKVYDAAYKAKEALSIADEIYRVYVPKCGYEDRFVRGFIMKYADMLAYQGRLDESVEILNFAYENVKNLDNLDWKAKENFRLVMASCYAYNDKDKEALEIRRQLYMDVKKCFDATEPIILDTGRDLLSSYIEVGYYDEAEAVLNELKKAYAKITMTWIEKTDLQECEIDILCGKKMYAKALEIYEEMYQIYVDIYGEGHHLTVGVGLDIAECLLDIGEDKRGLERYEEELSKLRKKYGENHAHTQYRMDDYAYMLRKMQRYEEALELADKSLKWMLEQYGPVHQNTLGVYNQIAEIYLDMNDFDNAKAYALQVEEKAGQSKHLLWARIRSLDILARVYEALGYNQETSDSRKKIWELVLEQHGENHISTIEKEVGYAATLSNIGEAERAVELIESCYDRAVALMGEDYIDLVDIKYSLAYSYYGANNYKKGLAIGMEVEQAYLEELEDVSSRVVSSKILIIECLKKLYLYDEAIQKNIELLDILEQNNKSNKMISEEVSRLGHLYYVKGDYDEAETMFARFCDLNRDMLRASDIDILTVLRKRGDICRKKGQYKEAIFYYDKVMAAGNDWGCWGDLDNTRNTAAMCYIGLEQYDTAIELIGQVEYYDEEETEQDRLINFIDKLLNESMEDAAVRFEKYLNERFIVTEPERLCIKNFWINHYMEEGCLEKAKQLCCEILARAKDVEEDVDQDIFIDIQRKMTLMEAVLHNAQEAMHWGEQYLKESLDYFREDAYAQFFALMDMAWACQYVGNNSRGQEILNEAMKRMDFFEVDEEDELYYHRIRAKYLVDEKRFADATLEMESVMDLVEERSETDWIVDVNNSLAYLAYAEGRLEDAKAYLEEAIHRTKYSTSHTSPYMKETYDFLATIG